MLGKYGGEIANSLLLKDGCVVEVMKISTLEMPEQDITMNVFCYSGNGDFLWRISGVPTIGKSPILGARLDGRGELLVQSFDGGVYRVDKETGKAKYLKFTK